MSVAGRHGPGKGKDDQPSAANPLYPHQHPRDKKLPLGPGQGKSITKSQPGNKTTGVGGGKSTGSSGTGGGGTGGGGSRLRTSRRSVESAAAERRRQEEADDLR